MTLQKRLTEAEVWASQKGSTILKKTLYSHCTYQLRWTVVSDVGIKKTQCSIVEHRQGRGCNLDRHHTVKIRRPHREA